MPKSLFNLSGKVALVTGGGSGLGRAYCEAMAEYGADVICNDISEAKAQETVELIRKYQRRVMAVPADASEAQAIKSMVHGTVKDFGSIDIVFANAAYFGDKNKPKVKIHQTSVADWDKTFALDLRGVFLLMQSVFPVMMKQKSGCFITTSAGTGIWPLPPVGNLHMASAYITAKTGVIMLNKIAARQYGEYGIRVNVICPGYHRTPLVQSEQMEKFVKGHTPLKRVGLPEDIKGLAVYLASDASSFVTGQTFVEDGGFMA